jgi:amino-acid N-acetyltransferase
MVVIRHAKKSDFDAVKKLVESYPHHLMNEIPSIERFFVAIDNDKIVGCCALDIYSKRIAEVRSLAVDKHYQKLRVGTQLVDRCVAHAKEKEIKEIFVITGRPNLFSELGFGTFQGERLALFKKL